ncbi:hypothetical protein Taro_031385 [Colocasia esculenta]|uniref:DC1 domain-containing protein n=1 Tax=Colocasia esculenta TaxID=4460 RepID=A0A843W0Q6_COLES|nr:hypothetical protein [Colocasia esculenta]
MVAFDVLNHESHPEHTLKLKLEETPYKCNVCKELGFHMRYTCEKNSCSVHLHKGCAEASPTFQHSFYQLSNFFLIRTGKPRRICDACGMDVQGSIYHCYDSDRDLHPCCAHLERRIVDGDMELKLHKEMPSKCYICGEKKLQGRSTWGYVSKTDKSCSLHIACVKKQMLEIWMKQTSFGKGKEGYSTNKEAADQGDGRALVKRTPMLQLAIRETKGAVAASGKFAKIKKTVKIAITFIIAAILGDPTAIVAGLICNLISH